MKIEDLRWRKWLAVAGLLLVTVVVCWGQSKNISGSRFVTAPSNETTATPGQVVTLGTNETYYATPSGGGGGSSATYFNGTAVTNANFADSSTLFWLTSGTTNASGYPTNLANAQIATSAAIALSKLATTGTLAADTGNITTITGTTANETTANVGTLAVTNKTGTGAPVYSTAPTLTNATVTGTLTAATGAIATGTVGSVVVTNSVTAASAAVSSATLGSLVITQSVTTPPITLASTNLDGSLGSVYLRTMAATESYLLSNFAVEGRCFTVYTLNPSTYSAIFSQVDVWHGTTATNVAPSASSTAIDIWLFSYFFGKLHCSMVPGGFAQFTVPYGGTGLIAGTSGGVVGFTGTATMASSSLLVSGDLMTGGGAGATPSTLAHGGTGQVLEYNGSANAYVTTVYFRQTSDVTVANTVTETTVLGTVTGSKNILSNELIVGRNLRGVIRGYYSTDTVAPTIRVKIKIGSTTVLDTTARTMSGSASNNYFESEFGITCRTVGVSGTVKAEGKVLAADPVGLTTDMLGMVNTSTSTIDTTISNTVDATVQWGTANANNTITISNVILESTP